MRRPTECKNKFTNIVLWLYMRIVIANINGRYSDYGMTSNCQIHTETMNSKHLFGDKVSALPPLSPKLSTLGHELHD